MNAIPGSSRAEPDAAAAALAVDDPEPKYPTAAVAAADALMKLRLVALLFFALAIFFISRS